MGGTSTVGKEKKEKGGKNETRKCKEYGQEEGSEGREGGQAR